MKVQGAFPVTMLPGDGVGPELMHAVKEVFKVSSLWRGGMVELPAEMDGLSWKGQT